MKILMISSFFPPFYNAESIVNGKLAYEFVRKGVNLTVLTKNFDARSTALDGSSYWKKGLGQVIRLNPPWYTSIRKLGRIPSLIKIPDYYSSWFGAEAYSFGKKLLERNSFDLLLTRCGPFEDILASLYLKRKFKIKWVISLNDPAPAYFYPEPYCFYTPGRIRNLLLKWQIHLAREAFTYADKLIFPCRRLGKYMERKLNLSLEEKMFVIPHIGWSKKGEEKEGGIINIMHIGRIEEARAQINIQLLTEFKNAIQGDLVLKRKLKMTFLGEVRDSFKESIQQKGLGDLIIFQGPVSYEESLEKISEASALLLIEAPLEEGIFLPSKFCDYAVARKPLLMFSPENGTIADLVGGYSHPGFLGQKESRFKEGITRFLRRLSEGKDLSDYVYPRPWEFEEKRVIEDFLSALEKV